MFLSTILGYIIHKHDPKKDLKIIKSFVSSSTSRRFEIWLWDTFLNVLRIFIWISPKKCLRKKIKLWQSTWKLSLFYFLYFIYDNNSWDVRTGKTLLLVPNFGFTNTRSLSAHTRRSAPIDSEVFYGKKFLRLEETQKCFLARPRGELENFVDLCWVLSCMKLKWVEIMSWKRCTLELRVFLIRRKHGSHSGTTGSLAFGIFFHKLTWNKFLEFLRKKIKGNFKHNFATNIVV